MRRAASVGTQRSMKRAIFTGESRGTKGRRYGLTQHRSGSEHKDASAVTSRSRLWRIAGTRSGRTLAKR
jgi:hypothetical protein